MNYYRRKRVQRESFDSIGETCPAVDRAFEACVDVVKAQTTALREALEEWIDRALDAEDRVEELEAKVKELEAALSTTT